jgi:hypothetical protein
MTLWGSRSHTHTHTHTHRVTHTHTHTLLGWDPGVATFVLGSHAAAAMAQNVLEEVESKLYLL